MYAWRAQCALLGQILGDTLRPWPYRVAPGGADRGAKTQLWWQSPAFWICRSERTISLWIQRFVPKRDTHGRPFTVQEHHAPEGQAGRCPLQAVRQAGA